VRCYCCERTIVLARKVKLRGWREFDPSTGGADSMKYRSYEEETTYRWAVICEVCFKVLDNAVGFGQIQGKHFNLAGRSRGGKASVIDEIRYREFQRREAKKLGLDEPNDA